MFEITLVYKNKHQLSLCLLFLMIFYYHNYNSHKVMLCQFYTRSIHTMQCSTTIVHMLYISQTEAINICVLEKDLTTNLHK